MNDDERVAWKLLSALAVGLAVPLVLICLVETFARPGYRPYRITKHGHGYVGAVVYCGKTYWPGETVPGDPGWRLRW